MIIGKKTNFSIFIILPSQIFHCFILYINIQKLNFPPHIFKKFLSIFQIKILLNKPHQQVTSHDLNYLIITSPSTIP